MHIDEWSPFTATVYRERLGLEELERKKRLEELDKKWKEKFADRERTS